MDDEKSPKDDHSVSPPPDMAAAVASMPQPPPPPSSSPTPANAAITANKRYRPAPAKTFQCRGYGECRMVFSRSEHLARHIRKHTGERPFTCHCSKQFSRLDNLRQHAQTVHADKQEQNERMMHELTSLHASMTAAAKGGQPRGKRAQAQAQAAALAAATANSSSGSNGTLDGSLPSMSIKQEDPVMSVPSMRPGTSTGRPPNSHSFRDSSQSFRAPSSPTSTSPSSAYPQHHFQSQQHHHSVPGQSFLVPSSTFNFSVPDVPANSSNNLRPRSSSGPRPPSADTNRSLPPISAVVSSSLPPALALSQHQQQLQSHPSFILPQQHGSSSSITSSHVLPLPTPTVPYVYGRPSTATRPGTAPASFISTNAFSSRSGSVSALVSQHRPELSTLSFLSGQHGRWQPSYSEYTSSSSSSLHRSTSGSYDAGGDEPTSPTGGAYESPFSFHAPTTTTTSSFTDSQQQQSISNPRKRPHSGSDDDDGTITSRGRGDLSGRPISSGGVRRPGTSSQQPGGGEYEYGSESRPQSRRLSVMELCNDTDADATTIRPFVPISASGGGTGSSRPTTSSGLVTSASQLAIVDRSTPSPPAASTFAYHTGIVRRSHSPSDTDVVIRDESARTGTTERGGSVFRPSSHLFSRAESSATTTTSTYSASTAVGAGIGARGTGTPTTTTARATTSGGRGLSQQQQQQQYYRQQQSSSPVLQSGGGVYGRKSSPLSSPSSAATSVGSRSGSVIGDGNGRDGNGNGNGGESGRTGNDQVRVAVGMRV
ncbi:hypothetical protein ABKN59_010325 [Abortiporus biennis]